MSSLYTCVRNITIIWCTVSKVQSETDIMIPLLMIPKINIFKTWKKKTPQENTFYTFTINEDNMICCSCKIRRDRQLSFYTSYRKWQSFDMCLLWYGTWRTEVFVILDHFLLFYNPKNQKFWKNKKAPGHIIILSKCTKTMIICYTVPKIRCVTDRRTDGKNDI